MPKQQQQPKRRRRRYAPGSAYAGDVRPTGILGLMGSRRMIQVVFILMALALAGGGFVGFFGANVFGGGSSNNDDFVVQDKDGDKTPEAGSTPEQQLYTSPPPMSIDPAKSYLATIKTADGEIQVRLFADRAPQTVNNFVFLAREGFYEGLNFSYVQPGFSAQAGSPGEAGGGPTYELPAEKAGTFEKGTLGMASASEFFIALSDSESAARQYQEFTPFGEVTAGLDVAEKLTQGVKIQSIEVSEG